MNIAQICYLFLTVLVFILNQTVLFYKKRVFNSTFIYSLFWAMIKDFIHKIFTGKDALSSYCRKNPVLKIKSFKSFKVAIHLIKSRKL